MRHHDDGDPVIVQLLKNSHDFDAGSAVEISGRLVSEQDFRIVDQAPAQSRRAAAVRRKAGSDDDLRGLQVRPHSRTSIRLVAQLRHSLVDCVP